MGAPEGRLPRARSLDASRRRAERFVLGRYLAWLRTEQGLDFAGYDELWRWSVSDLEGFWSAVWEFFEVRSHAPYERVLGSREMPGAEWFPGAR